MLVDNLPIENDTENLILKKLVQMENGIMQSDASFISKISNYPNFENYLFSNWMMPYFFGDYIENGFSKNTNDLPHLINTSQIVNSTIKNGTYYLQAVTKRNKRDWKGYENIIRQVNAVREWEHCGVFENLNSSGIEMPYEPEENTSSNISFNAHSKGDAAWYKPRDDVEAYEFLINHDEYGSGVHYAQTFVYSPREQRVHLKLGKGGLIRVRLNDVLIVEDDNEYITELDAYTVAVNLQKGVNRILLKSATNGTYPYFILRLEDLNGNPLKDYEVSFKDKEYKKGNLNSVNPVFVPHEVETYFEKKIKDSNSDINLNTFCLYLTYFRNGRLNKAIELLKSWSNEYPESSLIKSCLLECYGLNGDNTISKKLQNNIKRTDPEYYLSLMLEFEKLEDLMKLDIEKYESKLRKIGDVTDYSFMKTITEFMILFRQNARQKMRQKLDTIICDPNLPSSLKSTIAEFNSSVFNDDNAAIKILETYNTEEYNWEIIKYLGYYYKKQNRIEDAIKLYENSLQFNEIDNNVHYEIILLLHDTGQFERSIKFIEKALENFPNSYLFTKLKGDAYVQLNKKAEAIKLYEVALLRSPSQYDLRVKINDLKNSKNPLNELRVKDAYNYIKANRETNTNNNYGLIGLFKQTNVLAYKNGGGEFNSTMIYKITAQNGVNIFKEYSLGLSGDFIINKSEIVKINGETVPADRNGSDLVFDGLEVGDVIYIDYDSRYTRSGRFYRDYILTSNFTSYHPMIKSDYRLLTHDKKVNFKVTNGNVDYKTANNGEFYVHHWSLNNSTGIPISEDYMPTFSDVITRLHISSVDSWNIIALWYSDLVRKQLKTDSMVIETFKTIFPEGYKDLSETERAKKIYYYLTENLNYSHVNFRQGGYIPQKPSKTIKTKLGDCKDFSSLFLVLAKLAELDSKLVLILTSDHGYNELELPSTDFNHCIVNVELDGAEQYLELTDKYLPFKSLPISLEGAKALVIPFDRTEVKDSDLFTLQDVSRKKAIFKSNSIVKIDEKISKIDLNTTVSGHLASYYIEMFKSKKDKLLNEAVLDEISNRSRESIQLLKIKDFSYDKNIGEMGFKTELTSNLKISKIADIYTFTVPYFTNPYNDQIIQEENRSYPLDYRKYENSDSYSESILLKLNRNQKFVDLPNNAEYNFKEHNFTIKYNLLSQNELSVEISAKVNLNEIVQRDYEQFKIYINNVLKTRDSLIKFKTL